MRLEDLAGLDLNRLVVLAVLLEEGGVSPAARRLGRTQSAVSHTLAQLREDLGDDLLVRVGRGMAPTPFADRLRFPLMTVLGQLGALTRGAAFDPATARRTFRVGWSDYLQLVVGGSWLPPLRMAAPGIDLVAVAPPPGGPAPLLADGRLDLAFDVGLSDDDTLKGRLLFEDAFATLAGARGGFAPGPLSLEQVGERLSVARALRENGLDVLDADEVASRLRHAEPGLIALLDGAPPVLDNPDQPTLRVARADERARVRVVCGKPLPDPALPANLPSLSRLGRSVFAALPAPILAVDLIYDARRWRILDLRTLALADLAPAEQAELYQAAAALPDRKGNGRKEPHLPSLAVLWAGRYPGSASSAETLDKLAQVGARMGLRVEMIGPDDLDRLGDHDALFIRMLTGVNQPAWRFATRAQALGMPVIDQPDAIVRCSNKVYLFELLRRSGLPMPATVVVDRATTWEELVEALGAPVVLKDPDGSFSTGVFKLESAEDLRQRMDSLMERSPLLIAQAWLPTSFDWRVGVLGRKPVWAARYHMVTGHWQISASHGHAVRFGRVEAVPLDQAPKDVVRLASRAADLIGDGLFGVDLKETPDGPVVIEVNDNPNLDLGYEDAASGDSIYEAIVGWFLQRLRADAPRAAQKIRSAAELPALQRPIGRALPARSQPYSAYEVVGLELEYSLVDRDLNVVHLAPDVLAGLAGRPCSDVVLGRVGISNEIMEHVIEIKNQVPHGSLARAEADLVEGVRRVALLLDQRHRARMLPGGMHPWFRPEGARTWRRSNRRIYDTYTRLFNVQTHGWANVQAVHVNLPLGSPEEATAMMNAARLLVPYLPALAASSPLVEGEMTGRVDNRVAWLLEHQARIPESMARLVPEPLRAYGDYKKNVLAPMYAAVDRLPDAEALRAEFLNARGAVFKASRASMELRILDVQECVAMDMAIACFVRRALRDLAQDLSSLAPADQGLLERDLLAVATGGSRARVMAPHLPLAAQRAADGGLSAQQVLAWHLERVSHRAKDERAYLDRVADVVAQGSLSERILARLTPLADDESGFTEAARGIYIELADCLVDNRPWTGRSHASPERP